MTDLDARSRQQIRRQRKLLVNLAVLVATVVTTSMAIPHAIEYVERGETCTAPAGSGIIDTETRVRWYGRVYETAWVRLPSGQHCKILLNSGEHLAPGDRIHTTTPGFITPRSS
jgi:hypothetical protein